MADKQAITRPAGRALLTAVENAQLRKDIPELKSGDTVRLQVKVVEGNRERLQPFEGVIMRLRGGGVNENFTVRRITHGVGVERTFLIHSPRIEKIEVVRSTGAPPAPWPFGTADPGKRRHSSTSWRSAPPSGSGRIFTFFQRTRSPNARSGTGATVTVFPSSAISRPSTSPTSTRTSSSSPS